MARIAVPNVLRDPVLFDDCTAMTRWADQFGTASRKTQVSTYRGRSCLQMTGMDSTLQANCTLTASLALQKDAEAIYVLWASPDVVLTETSTRTRVYVYPETAAGSNTPDTTNYVQGEMSCAGQLPGQWNLSCVPLSKMTVAGSGAITDLQTKKVSRIGIRMTVASGTKPDFYLGGIWVGGATRAKVMLAYDGCYISQKTLAKVAHDLYDMPGTLYVAKHKLDSGAGYLTSADLDTFYAAGWDICGHSWSVDYGYDDYRFNSAQQIADEIGNFREWARGRGFSRGDGHWAWPYSIAADNADQTTRLRAAEGIQKTGLKTIRIGSAGASITHLRPPAASLDLTGETGVGTVFAPQLTSSLSVAQARALITTATLTRLPVMVYAHEIAANQGATVSGSASNYITPTNYDQTTAGGATQSLMPWLNVQRGLGLLDVVTPSQFYSSFLSTARQPQE